MIEEHAVVCKVQGRQVWVQTLKTSACKQCDQQQGCSSAVLENTARPRELQVESDFPLAVGDRVVLGVESKGLLKSAALLYLVPLIALLLGGSVGNWIASRLYVLESDVMSVFFALAFFLGSLLYLNRLHRLGWSKYLANPTILRKL
ncbi:MAG: SoxR reducing system RseC family protein [Gammaproteobacteria bacterium]